MTMTNRQKEMLERLIEMAQQEAVQVEVSRQTPSWEFNVPMRFTPDNLHAVAKHFPMIPEQGVGLFFGEWALHRSWHSFVEKWKGFGLDVEKLCLTPEALERTRE